MDLEYSIGLMELDIKDIGKIIKPMEKVNSFMLEVIFSKVNG